MIGALRRKLGHVLDDPALRRWMLLRALGRTAAPPAFVPGHPTYLASLDLGGLPELPAWRECPAGAPSAPITLPLPGETVTLAPGEADGLFTRSFADLETRLAVHRFAWLPLLGPGIDPAWVCALWAAWRARHGTPGPGWDWHPYTAAERAINLLAFARLHGMPEGALPVLAAHAPAIAARLEYGGEHYTGNHLSNNGRGLYLLGRALGWPAAERMGLAILLEEAARIFAPSGVLREGSSHYHLLLTRNYLSCWLAGRDERLEAICRRALAVLPHLDLPGGLPLVGDISPDCPPAYLMGLLGKGGGWLDWLDAGERAAIAALAGGTTDPAADGWLRADHGEFSGLWHASPAGWPFMPGHGHHDLGSFELHWRGLPLFVDAGRGAYGESGHAALYRSAQVHNLLQVDGADPTPANRPYYDDAFRALEGGTGARLERLADGVRLVHDGFRRQRVTRAERVWRFAEGRLEIADELDGRGLHTLTRRLVTPWPVRLESGTTIVDTPAGSVRLKAEEPFATRPVIRWTAYGEGAPATALETFANGRLPWRGSLIVEAC